VVVACAEYTTRVTLLGLAAAEVEAFDEEQPATATMPARP
jgi:hypothetical protein